MSHLNNLDRGTRWKTREVMVGNVGVGGNNPVRIQSMTTSSTRDVEATFNQIMRLVDEGCEIVRVTVQGIKEADACEAIKNLLIQKGITIPIVADIHFYPPAAMRVIDFVDKVRINPGNFVDKRASFKIINYDDASYAEEIIKIEEKFIPLIEKCKKLKRAMRIGTNHGSLSDRIMNRYGDTPHGMLESALEFARICRAHDYHDFMFSMKSSNPKVMISAYRLLVTEMIRLGWNYPLHLGVTEAGQGEDGRIKSAMGIGTLLLEGIGDTIRVSLTEDAYKEIDPCKRLIHFAEKNGKLPLIFPSVENIEKRQVKMPKSNNPQSIGLHRDGSVFLSVTEKELMVPDLLDTLGCEEKLGRIKITALSTDSIVLCHPITDELAKKAFDTVLKIGIGALSLFSDKEAPITEIIPISEIEKKKQERTNKERFTLQLHSQNFVNYAIRVGDELKESWTLLKDNSPSLIIFSPTKDRLYQSRVFFRWLQDNQITAPVILNFSYTTSAEDLVIQASAEFGALLSDGLGDGIWIEGNYPINLLRFLSFGILQAARMRMSKTDFISCPSCGRTLFDLQSVTKRITERTAHLPGVKIAIMGCIVNGPGEMADADFGYVGSKPGMIDLYVGKTCIEKDVQFANADDRLVELIKSHGRWLDP